jgi:bifunctional DNase/RNase
MLALTTGCGRLRHRADRRESSCTPATPALAEAHAPSGYVPMTVTSVKPRGDSAVVELSSPSQEIVRVYVGGTEGQSLRLRQTGRTAPRPLTHDLLDSVLRELKAEVVQAQVDELRDGVFIGTLVVSHEGKAFNLDARPSDAIALAVGAKAPIFMAKKVIREAATPSVTPSDDDGESSRSRGL